MCPQYTRARLGITWADILDIVQEIPDSNDSNLFRISGSENALIRSARQSPPPSLQSWQRDLNPPFQSCQQDCKIHSGPMKTPLKLLSICLSFTCKPFSEPAAVWLLWRTFSVHVFFIWWVMFVREGHNSYSVAIMGNVLVEIMVWHKPETQQRLSSWNEKEIWKLDRQQMHKYSESCWKRERKSMNSNQ